MRGTEKAMKAEVMQQIEGLRSATVRKLRERYKEVFGEESRSNHKEFLFRRIAWRLQALADGDLSERARQHALEIAQDADLRICGPKHPPQTDGAMQLSTLFRRGARHDGRLPSPGTVLVREFKNRRIAAQVLGDGFQYEGRFYKSLSAIAREVTGTQWNGYSFFGLTGGRPRC